MVEFVDASKKNATKLNNKDAKRKKEGSRRLVQVVFLFVAKFVFFSLFHSSSNSSKPSTRAPPHGDASVNTSSTPPPPQLRNKGMLSSPRTSCRKSPTLNVFPLFVSFSSPSVWPQALFRGRLVGPRRLRPLPPFTPGRLCRGGGASELS